MAPGQHLAITVLGTAVVVHPHPVGLFVVPSARYVVLPASVRRRCGFQQGDRVLLAADSSNEVLVVHPMAALDSMITAYHSALLGGGDDEQRAE